jgi:hypothetical protein
LPGGRKKNQGEEEKSGGGEDADMRVPVVGEGEERKRVTVRVLMMGRGLVSLLGRKSSPGSISIFILFSSFPFLFSYFFCIFCKNASIRFKPLSEIF